MSAAVAVRDLHSAMSNLQVEVGAPAPRTRNDAQIGIKELQVLRLDVDMVAPADAAEIAEPLVEAYSGKITNGDHLRLPQVTNFDGPAMRGAVNRILAVDADSVALGTPAQQANEARMRRVLTALQDTVTQIQAQAGFRQRG